MPLRQLPISGVRAGSRPYGSRAREPLTPAAAVVPPSVPASISVGSPLGVSAKLAAPDSSITGSADTSVGILLGPKPTTVSEPTVPSASPTGTPMGVSSPSLGSCSTRTSSAMPHVLPVSASKLDRPTVHAGYWPVMASVSDNTWKTTSTQVAVASGAWAIARHRRGPPLGGAPPRPEKWNQAATTRVTSERPSSTVVKPICHRGKSFDHGTPKFETYHQPLTVANDSAVTNSTAAANNVRLRREPIAAAETATAASAPSDPASPANTPKWWVHLVGVNIIARNAMTVIPMMRRLGPSAVPGILPLRSDIATATASASSNVSTAKRRATDPSGLVVNRRE